MKLDSETWQLPAGCEDFTRLDTRAPDPGVKASRMIKSLREKHRRLLARRDTSILLVIQGVDTTGKNSLIRHLGRGLDPEGFRAWSFGPPAGAELEHDFLWRVHGRLPAQGELVAFNRSYYEAVLAERLWPVRAPTGEPDWAERRRAINAFERHLVFSGTRILKCWLHLSDDEHRARLLERLDDPRKQWKFDPQDLRNFREREHYRALARETVTQTHTELAPWHIIPADDKERARVIVAGILGQSLDALAPDWPPSDEALLAEMRRELDA